MMLVTKQTSIAEKGVLVFKNSRGSRFRPVNFDHVEDKKFVVEAVPEKMTGQAGAILISAVERKVGLVRALAGLVKDGRAQNKVRHCAFDMLVQRVCQIGVGHVDGNDCDWLRKDSAIKAALGRHPIHGRDGVSQETMCKFENMQDAESLKELENLFLDDFMKGRKRPRKIDLDIDGSPVETHGAQEGAVYRGGKKYGYEMYFPLFVFCSKWLISVSLRQGSEAESKTVIPALERCVSRIRSRWRGVRIRVRLDAGFGSAELYRWCRKNNIGYLVGLKSTSVLTLYTRTTAAEAKRQFREKFGEPKFLGPDGGKKAQEEHARIRALRDKKERMAEEARAKARRIRLFHEFSHKAETWDRWERVIVRVDYTDKGIDCRYVMVGTQKGRPRAIYRDEYCRRGLMEQFLGNLKGVAIRLSAQTFAANQFRLILYGIAYQLLGHLQEQLIEGFQQASPKTIQRDLLNVPAVFRETKTKVVMQISEDRLHCKEFLSACRKLRAG